MFRLLLTSVILLATPALANSNQGVIHFDQPLTLKLSEFKPSDIVQDLIWNGQTAKAFKGEVFLQDGDLVLSQNSLGKTDPEWLRPACQLRLVPIPSDYYQRKVQLDDVTLSGDYQIRAVEFSNRQRVSPTNNEFSSSVTIVLEPFEYSRLTGGTPLSLTVSSTKKAITFPTGFPLDQCFGSKARLQLSTSN